MESNHRDLVVKATAVPTEPQPLPPPLAVFSPSLTAGRHQRLYASPLSKVSIIPNAKNDEIAKIKSDENNAFSQKTFKDVSSPSFDRFYFGKFFFNLQPTYLPT